MNVDYLEAKVRTQIEHNMSNLPKKMSRTIRKLKSEKGYTDKDILLHLNKMFRYTLTIVCLNISVVTFFRLFYYTHADLFAERSLGSMNTHMSLDLYMYLIFMIPAIIYVINAFSIYKTKIIYKQILYLHEIIEKGEGD